MTATVRSSLPLSAEAGGVPVAFGSFPDDEAALDKAVRKALETGTSSFIRRHLQGRGRPLTRIVSQLGKPAFSCMAWHSSRASRSASR